MKSERENVGWPAAGGTGTPGMPVLADRAVFQAELDALTQLAERLTADIVDLRLRERREGAAPPAGWLCRLCDFEACGRSEGRCPAATTAAAHQS